MEEREKEPEGVELNTAEVGPTCLESQPGAPVMRPPGAPGLPRRRLGAQLHKGPSSVRWLFIVTSDWSLCSFGLRFSLIFKTFYLQIALNHELVDYCLILTHRFPSEVRIENGELIIALSLSWIGCKICLKGKLSMRGFSLCLNRAPFRWASSEQEIKFPQKWIFFIKPETHEVYLYSYIVRGNEYRFCSFICEFCI